MRRKTELHELEARGIAKQALRPGWTHLGRPDPLGLAGHAEKGFVLFDEQWETGRVLSRQTEGGLETLVFYSGAYSLTLEITEGRTTVVTTLVLGENCPSRCLPNSPVKPHAMLANNISCISIMIHQLLFAKNITQIAQRIKLL